MRTRSQSREQHPPPPEEPPVVIEPLRIEYPFQERFPRRAMQTLGYGLKCFQAPIRSVDIVEHLPLVDQMNQASAPAPATCQAVELSCVIAVWPISSDGSGTLPGNTVTNPREDLKGITTRSGVAYQDLQFFFSVVKQHPRWTKDQVHPSCSQSTAPVQPPVGPEPITTPVFEPIVAPVVAPVPNTKPSVSLPYPSRRDNEKSRNQANEQIDKFYEIFKKMSFEISFTELWMDECLALADLGASINLMPFSVWEKLSLPNLIPTCMTLELADRSISKPMGIAKDISVKVGVFHFPADFVVVDFEPSLDVEEKSALIRCLLKVPKRALGLGNLSDISGIQPGILSHQILMKRLCTSGPTSTKSKSKNLDVIKKWRVEKLLGSWIDFTLSPTVPWVSPVHVYKEGGNNCGSERGELRYDPTRLVPRGMAGVH
ncbi:reverse transcriptase domain-containing protein [Tanacetum coccineum]